jgi:ribosomal-protein-alanine N-acetyltransferase
MKIPSLHGSRLTLRPFLTDDASPLHGIYQMEDVLKFFPGPINPPLESVERFVSRQDTHWQAYGFGNWAISPNGKKEIIGWAGLQYLPELDETEVGYLFARPYWGQGFATEAASLSIQFGFEEIGLTQLIALVHPENHASIAVLKKCGFGYKDTIPLWGTRLMRHIIEKT